MVWKRVSVALILSTVLLLSGCVVPAAPDVDLPTVGEAGNGETGTPETGTVKTDTEGTDTRETGNGGTDDGNAGGDGTATGTSQGSVDPYGGETLVVAIDDGGTGSRDYAPLVRRALAFWEENASRYAGYDVSYRVDPAAADPDFVVTVVDRIENCGSDDEHSAGCAPVITRPEQFSPPVRVRVVGNLSDESTVRVLIHEFGHTLGLGHDDEPQSMMQARGRLATLPRIDARNRTYAWSNSTLTVYVDVDDPGDRETVERQVRETLAYFDRGAEGTVPENVSFVRVSNRTRADVVVQVGGENPCEGDAGSCRRLRGLDPDDDDRLESYDRLEVYVFGLDPEAVGWHVGRHLGHALGLDEEEGFPEPLRSSASYEERRSDWWTSD